jgi:hypothetical protein
VSFRKPQTVLSGTPALSPGDVEELEEIRAELRRNGRSMSFDEIINIALWRLQQDLVSDCANEVLEDLQREIVYRRWCARKYAEEPGPLEVLRSTLSHRDPA